MARSSLLANRRRPRQSIMNALRTALQIPLLVVIVYLGSINLYMLIQAWRGPWFGFDWHFFAYFAEGFLEVVLLVWLYRWLAPPAKAGEKQA
jgi:hypothetical protein